jgi:hypothetical protein
VVDRLLAQGHPLRAMVRTDDDRAADLRRRGAATVVAANWRRVLEIDTENNPGSSVNKAMVQHISIIGVALSRRSEPLVAPDPTR